MTEFTVATYVGGTIISLFIGILTGIFGVGGGFLMAPALISILCLPANIAVGTDLSVIFVNSSWGMFKRRKSGTVDYKLGATIASGSVVGVRIGLAIMEKLKGMEPLVIFGKEQVAVQYMLLCLFLLLLIYITVFMARDLRKKEGKTKNSKPLFSVLTFAPHARFSTLTEPRTAIIPVIAFGLTVGILTGLMGVGGGVIMLPALICLIGQHPTKAAGTSLLIVWASSLIGGTGHIFKGNFEFVLLICMLAGGLVGTNIGTHIGLKLHGDKIKKYFVLVVAAAVIMVAVKLYLLTFTGSTGSGH